jgi:hypothetical protein
MQTPPPTYAQYPRFRSPEIRFDVIGEAFSLFSKKPGVYIVAALPTIVMTILTFGVSIGAQFLAGDSLSALGPALLVQYSFQFLAYLVQFWQFAGITRLAIRDLRGEEIKAGDAFTYPGAGAAIGAGICMSLIIFAGTLACCVPGLIANGVFMLTYPLISVGGMKAFEAMGKSWELLKPHLWPATGLAIVLALLVAVAAGTCIGAFVGIPVYGIAIAMVYRDFVEDTGIPMGTAGTSGSTP